MDEKLNNINPSKSTMCWIECDIGRELPKIGQRHEMIIHKTKTKLIGEIITIKDLRWDKGSLLVQVFMRYEITDPGKKRFKVIKGNKE